MNKVLKLQAQLKNKPFGNKILSYALAKFAPYFLTIKPQVVTLRPNYMEAWMPKRRSVHNHLKTVHAIAMCNLCEFTAGILMETSIPDHRRWIPVSMQVKYLKKAGTDLTSSCDLSEVDWNATNEVDCFVSVKDTNGVEVMTANIQMKVDDRKKK